jgi:hypothetical protein
VQMLRAPARRIRMRHVVGYVVVYVVLIRGVDVFCRLQTCRIACFG